MIYVMVLFIGWNLEIVFKLTATYGIFWLHQKWFQFPQYTNAYVPPDEWRILADKKSSPVCSKHKNRRNKMIQLQICQKYKRIDGWSDRQILTHKISTRIRNRIQQLCGSGLCVWANTNGSICKTSNLHWDAKWRENVLSKPFNHFVIAVSIEKKRSIALMLLNDLQKPHTRICTQHPYARHKKPMQINGFKHLSTCIHNKIELPSCEIWKL